MLCVIHVIRWRSSGQKNRDPCFYAKAISRALQYFAIQLTPTTWVCDGQSYDCWDRIPQPEMRSADPNNKPIHESRAPYTWCSACGATSRTERERERENARSTWWWRGELMKTSINIQPLPRKTQLCPRVAGSMAGWFVITDTTTGLTVG